MIDLDDRVAIKGLIDDGIPCYYRYGSRSKEAVERPISQKRALELLPHYHSGIGFFELCTETIDGKESLVFNEYSEIDML